MNGRTFGALVAGAVVALGAANCKADSPEQPQGEKGCYRKSCGTSVKGHKGTCGGTRVEALTDEKSCTEAGGLWITAKEAEKYTM